ncbi:glycosyltransferase [Candidatus Saccharibacteria bacterium]|nr:glycosyltransferase [Candidatus Saccharibacteria bacterium]
MTKVKLLHFINSLNIGGAESLVKDYALLIDKEKFDVVILCHDRIGSLYEKLIQNAGIRILFISDFFPFKKLYFNRLVNKIVRHSYLDKLIAKIIIKKEKPDIIHSHQPFNRIIEFVNPSKKCKLFHTVHSEPKEFWCTGTRYANRDFKAVSSLIKKHGMRLIALHEPMRQELNQMFHVNNTVVLNNGIDFSRFNVSESKEVIRKELNISEDAFLVGHVGRFVPLKRHDLIVDSFYELCKIKKNAHLLLVGSGELRSHIEEKIKLMQLREKVTILEPRLDIPRIMKSLDVFIFPSLFEGLGIVLIEAQRMGVPCVVSDAIPEAANVSNLVVKMPKDSAPLQWAEKLNGACSIHPEYFGIEKWDMSIVVKQLENLYLQEISQG